MIHSNIENIFFLIAIMNRTNIVIECFNGIINRRGRRLSINKVELFMIWKKKKNQAWRLSWLIRLKITCFSGSLKMLFLNKAFRNELEIDWKIKLHTQSSIEVKEQMKNLRSNLVQDITQTNSQKAIILQFNIIIIRAWTM